MRAKILYTVLQVLGKMPSWWHYAWSSVFSYVVQYVIRYRREVVHTQLSKSFPDKDERAIRALERKYYQHLCDLGVEMIMLTSFDRRRLCSHVFVSNLELIEQIHQENNTIFFFLGHYGNWEWFTGLQAMLPCTEFNVLYKQQNGVWNEVMKRARSKFGSVLMEKSSAPKVIIRQRNDKKNRTYIFVADQTPGVAKAELFVDFLNQTTATLTGMDRLAKIRKAAVVYIDIESPKRGKYIVTAKEITRDASLLGDYELATAFMNTLEQTIVRQPELWLWSHKRWKFTPEMVKSAYPDKVIVRK